MFLQLIATLLLSFAISLAQTETCSSHKIHSPSHSESISSLLQTSLNLNFLNPFDGPRSLSSAPTTMSTSSFTVDELKYYNWFAASIYCPYTLPGLSCCYCGHFNESVTSVAIFENDVFGTKALVTLHPSKQEIVVTFRGTVALVNILMDAFFLPTPNNSSSGVRVHRGFYLSTISLYDEVVQQIGTHLAINPSFRVVVTGHSLGGAMASLFIYLIISLNQFPASGTNYALITFGQPRTGNRAYADFMNALNIPMARVVSRNDIVPHFIPVSALGTFQLLFGLYYVHHGREVWSGGPKEDVQFCSTSRYEDFNCSNSQGPLYSLLDHVQYFDADYTLCYFVEGWLDLDLLTTPIGLKPTTILPQMPRGLQNVVGGVLQGLHRGLVPVL